MNNTISPSELYKMYKKWVINNPNVVTDVETAVTWSSYFVAGKINKSPIVSELVYSLSKLLTMFNDKLIKEAYGTEVQYYGLKEQLKIWLTVIHYSEVLLELVISHKYKSYGKWSVATLLQLFKCFSSLILLYKYKEAPIAHPPVPPLQRKKFTEGKETDRDENSNSFFKLKRSGRVVRKVDGAPPVSFRDWQPIKVDEKIPNPSIHVKDIMYAETVQLLKPLVHLGAMRYFGVNAWSQWAVALSMDLVSLQMYKKHMNNLSYEQRLEISRRKLCLVLYLLRSPMYKGYSKGVIESVLTLLSIKIPLASIVCDPIIQYLSHWTNIYFYMWAS